VARRLQLIGATLATAQHRNAFLLPLEPPIFNELSRSLAAITSPEPANASAKGLSIAQRDVLDFLQVLLAELARLAKNGNLQAVRGFGYQYHNLPSALRYDQPYDRSPHSGSFEVAAAHWDELSADMRHAFCEYAGVNPVTADRLVRQKGFADTSEY
jgi:hypothetical protein